MPEPGTSGLASALDDLYTSLYEVRTGGSRVTLSDNVLTWMFTGGLSAMDELLVDHNRHQQVRSFREAFMKTVQPRVAEVIEIICGRPVLSSVVAFEPAGRITTATFVLGEGGATTQEQAAIRNWGAQVRRKSSALRAASVATREHHRALVAALREHLD